MPIEREQIPVLIKESELKPLPVWKKTYFDRIARALQVHTKGQLFAKIDTLFPNEHVDSKAHVIATYEPITKSSIWKGINDLMRIFSSSSFSFSVGDEVNDWLAEYEWQGENLLNFFLKEWIHKAVAEDPNGLFVVYPPDYAAENNMCPVQFVRSSLIKSRSKDYISFVSEMDSVVEYSFESVTTKREVFEDASIGGKLNARTLTMTTYNERLKLKIVKEVVHQFTRDGFIVYYRRANEDINTRIVDFAEPLAQLPIFPGGGPVADKADQELFESFVQAYVPFGNLALLQHRNHRAIDLTFSYPRMMELQVPCTACAGGKVRNPNGKGMINCGICAGSGFTTAQSPYKIYQPRYDPNDNNKNEHLKIDPVKFFSPEVGIINYSKDAWRTYMKDAEAAIFVTEKKETGQVESVEAKDRDLDDKHAWLLGVSKVFYNNLRLTLQCLEDYMSRNPVAVSVERPYSFAILTEGEAFLALNNILQSAAPIFIKINRLDNFVNKFISSDSPIHRALEVMKQYDPLLFYNGTEVQTFKGSNGINQEMYVKHILAYPVFLKLYMQDKSIVYLTDEQVMKLLDTEIAKYNLATAAPLRQSIVRQLEESVKEGEQTTTETATGDITEPITATA